MTALLLSAALTALACPPLPAPLGVVVIAPQGLEPARARAQAMLLTAGAEQLTAPPADPLTVESGWVQRQAKLNAARLRLRQAKARFQELDDRAALALVSELTTSLASAQVAPEAAPLLGQAHLLAAAIYLARDRVDAARARLGRALQLAPALQADPAQHSPRLIAELAAARSQAATRPQGSLQLQGPLPPGAQLFVDGQAQGPAAGAHRLPVGTHLIRVSAPGRQSALSTLRLADGQQAWLRPRLPPDPELRALATLPGALLRLRSKPSASGPPAEAEAEPPPSHRAPPPPGERGQSTPPAPETPGPPARATPTLTPRAPGQAPPTRTAPRALVAPTLTPRAPVQAPPIDVALSDPAGAFGGVQANPPPSRGSSSTRGRQLLRLLAARVGQPALLVALLRPSGQLGPDGAPTPALSLYLPDRPPVAVEHLTPAAVAQALAALARCDARPPAWAAPPIPGPGAPRTLAPPVYSPPLWRRPWFWATCGAVALGAAAALVAVENRSTAPDSYGITVIPRP